MSFCAAETISHARPGGSLPASRASAGVSAQKTRHTEAVSATRQAPRHAPGSSHEEEVRAQTD